MFAAGALLLTVGCSGSDADAEEHPDNPNLLLGFHTWLKTNDSERDDDLAGHALNVSLGYRSGDRHGVVEVLTDYGPWGEAEDQVTPLAQAFTEWWDEDPSAGSAHFLGQGGKTAKKTTLYEGDAPSNLLKDFRSWTAKNAPSAPNAENLTPHITALTIGYGAKGSGAVTVSTDYVTHKDKQTQKKVDTLSEAFADWWDGDEGADSVTVTSEDQGSHAERDLTAR
ncbi:hypothetical protein GCM10009837_16110 [Streptomyces durmitorensis]|uniref:Lipoprotein n=1 Tax=Streptomyces durmitorensis TaxID=319947 RepID=A0ABY4PRW2_9ACTN|nr:hypothetical protein [Streptomyces durmitorensis]UQT55678.1 hypothetical protein M4V62_11550 [Streptomyces durmitorensis]